MNSYVLRYNPAAEMLNWIDKMWGGSQAVEGQEQVAYRLRPNMDISEEEGRYCVSVDIPGLTKEDVGIKVENGVLKIEGERKDEKKGKYLQAERAYGRFVRVISLPDDVDTGKIEAKVANGVLELLLPKNKKALPIEVKIS